MHLKSLPLAFLLFSCCLAAPSTYAEDWKLAKQEHGITVYTRALADSEYKEFKGEMTLSATLTELLNFINNASICPAWQYRCLKMLNLSDNYLYKLSNLPWPLSDRYTVMHAKGVFQPDTQTYTLFLQNINRNQLPDTITQQLPKENDTVQMRSSDGYWQFKQLSATQIQITHQMHGDPAGALPASLANQGVVNAAFVTLLNLKMHFQRP